MVRISQFAVGAAIALYLLWNVAQFFLGSFQDRRNAKQKAMSASLRSEWARSAGGVSMPAARPGACGARTDFYLWFVGRGALAGTGSEGNSLFEFVGFTEEPQRLFRVDKGQLPLGALIGRNVFGPQLRRENDDLLLEARDVFAQRALHRSRITTA
jgi:hypothetical protein